MPPVQAEADELLTLGDFVRWGASRFNAAGLSYGHGTTNALDEAYHLVTHALHLGHELPPYMVNCRLTRPEREAVAEVIGRRIRERMPAPYITHEAWFAGLSFYVDERVLIPRSPLAELITARCEPWIDPDAVEDILDLCTGSGCIAIACALTFPGAQVDATDLSAPALEVARINIDRHRVADQVTLHEGDLYAGIEGRRYDIIVSNPPYVDAQDMAALPAEYHHEPALGLEAGVDGLDVVRRILKSAGSYLKPEGILVVEVGNSAAALMEAYPNFPFTWLEFEHDHQGVFLLTAAHVRELRDLL